MEFREISQMIWGLEIQELVDHMNNNPLFGPSHCYVLIKKCIRLSAYVNFNNESIYYGSTEDCFRFSIIAHKAIKNELVFLYDYFKNRSVDWPNDIKKLRDPIETVSNYLLTI